MKTLPLTLRRSTAVIAALAGILASAAPVSAQCPSNPPSYMKGKISKNFYRIPYADGENVAMVNDYFTHGGGMDTRGVSSAPVIVAAADGVICFVRDHLNDCGCADSSHPIGGCANRMDILHANGETSGYLHFAQFSIRDTFGVSDPNVLIGMPVSQGQPIGIEGDVGRTCSSGGSKPRWGTCITQAQAADLGNCYRHLHWAVRRFSTGELLEPMTCNVPFQIYADDVTYPAAPCPDSLFCIANAVSLPATLLSGLGAARVYQNNDAITAGSFTVQAQASAVFHARNRVRLLPGFHAGASDAYFRAELGLCNTTAP